MKQQGKTLPKDMLPLFDELEQECLTAVKYIEALKAKELTRAQREDILGELSASITHLRIQAEQLDRTLEDAGQL
jgi:regulator of sirC expression with transglutaminase-like and TPR domain